MTIDFDKQLNLSANNSAEFLLLNNQKQLQMDVSCSLKLTHSGRIAVSLLGNYKRAMTEAKYFCNYDGRAQ